MGYSGNSDEHRMLVVTHGRPIFGLKSYRETPMDQQDLGREMVVATIRASCPTCGDIELTSGDVTVLVCATNNQGSYAFQCPACRLAVSKAADPRVVDLLVSTGVRLSVWQLPAELDEQHDGPPLTTDDLIDFHFALETGDWLEQLRGITEMS